MKKKSRLRFVFSGYSVWLEPEQFQGDLDEIIQTASQELSTFPIQAPHATVLYGISHIPENEARRRFKNLDDKISEWPPLEQKGIQTEIEIEGVDGGEMVRNGLLLLD